MNLTYLKYAVEVEKTGSISLAARNLYLGQPNVSKAIKELENSLGITIFKRTPRGVLPTPKGEEFLHYAKSILTQIQELETMFQDEHADHISFHIATPHAEYITKAFADYASMVSEIGGMDMTIKETNAVDAIQRVAQQEYNMAIIRYDCEYENHFLTLMGDKGVEGKPIWEQPCVAVMSKKHPLAEKEVIEAKDLAEGVELLYGDKSIPYLSTVDARKSAAAEASKRHISIYGHAALFDLLDQVPGAYVWSSPVPQEILEKNGCVQRRCTGEVPMIKDVLIYLQDYRLKETDKQFIACVNRVKDELAWKEYK